MSATKWNAKNPAVRRIMQEIRELQQEESTEFIAEALEEDIFEFAFVVQGPPDTEFEGGVYHGRILLPSEYPFKPPSFVMLTPSGRFQTNVKICLSISSHHPEHWQPSWSVRTALTALIAFMPSPGAGALGSLDYTKEERQQLAAKSRLEAPRLGSASRQKVVDDLHRRMLALQEAAAAAGPSAGPAEAPDAALRRLRAEVEAAHGAGSGSSSSGAAAGGAERRVSEGAGADVLARPGSDQLPSEGGAVAADAAAKLDAAAAGQREDLAAGAADQAPAAAATAAGAPQLQQRRPAAAPAASDSAGWGASQGASRRLTVQERDRVWEQRVLEGMERQRRQQAQQQQQHDHAPPGDRGLTLLAVLLSVAIAVVLLRKIASALGGGGRVDAFVQSA